MSCQNNAKAAGRTAGVKAGISVTQNRFNSAVGQMAGVLTRRAGRSARTVLRVTESFDMPGLNSLTTAAAALEAGALLASRRGRTGDWKLPPAPPAVRELVKNEPQKMPGWAVRYIREQQAIAESNPLESGRQGRSSSDWQAGRMRRRATMAIGLLKLGQAAGTFAGTGLARLSRRGETGVTAGLPQQFFFPRSSSKSVRLWPSRLTPLFNRADAGLSRLQRSEGLMVEYQGQSWHRGAMVVKTAQGERTMTHLQSLTVPSTSYYFDRRLSDNETVGIVTGQKGFEPKSMEGYAGQIGEIEALFPAWAQTKRGLIRAHLRWGETSPRQPESKPAVKEQAGPEPKETGAIHPLDGVKASVTLGGQDYPVLVRRVVAGPDGRRRAEATYYDQDAAAWQTVEDDRALLRLAQQVQAGQIEPWEKMVKQ